jgi:hypothetical protein
MPLMPRTKLTQTLLCAIALACASAPALAALGGDATTVESDRARLKGALRVQTGDLYNVHEIQTGGLLVREFVSASGTVFAVSWQGDGIPDLQQMLGSYYTGFALAATSVPHYDHHHLNIQTPEVVVQSSGHTRSFNGRAWAPALLPEGFALSDLH